VLNEERALADLPERPATAKVGEELGLGIAQPEELARLRKLIGRLGVDDLRLCVGEQPFSETDLPGSLRSNRAEVGKDDA
jgi:hypothetical protein